MLSVMNEEITMDRITGMLHEITGFKADASQIDAVRVAMEAYAARLAQSYASAPSELAEAHLNSLVSLASQLLDTGGRMRLDPSGQLDAADAPLATRADVAGLAGAISTMRDSHSAQNDVLLERIRMMLPPSDTWPSGKLSSVPPVQVDLTPVMDLLTSVSSQVMALTSTVLAAQGQHSGEITAMAGDLAQLCEDTARLQLRLGELQAPAYVLQPVTAFDPAQMTSATHGFAPDEMLPEVRLPQWEAELLADEARQREERVRLAEQDMQDAVDKSLQILADLRKEEIAGIPLLPGKSRDEKLPGCFFNEDGTITCKICGKPKREDLFYKDKAAWTGRKSSCKMCEARRVAAKNAAARR